MPNAEHLPNAPPRAAVEHWMRQLQDEHCGQLSQLDGSGKAFTQNGWQHNTGHGCTRVLAHGDALEKSGVAFSVVRGELDAAAAQERWSYYAEFTLLFDRETRRGLATGQHLEGVLLGLPPGAEWTHQLQTVPASPRSLTLHWLLPGVNWLAAEPIPETASN